MLVRPVSLSALAVAALFSGAAQAAPLSATQVLQQFNVVVTGNIDSSSHVDGRSFAGGDVVGGDYVQHVNDTPASAYAGLTVGGNLSGANVNGLGVVVGGNIKDRAVNGGGAYIGGDATGVNFNGSAWVGGVANSVNFNGAGHAASLVNTNNNHVLAAPTAAMNSTLAASTSTNFGSVLGGLSSSLSTLHSTGSTVDFSNNNHQVTFNAVAQNGVAVFDLRALDSSIFSATTTDIAFNMNGATTVILNTDDKNLSLMANFNQAQSLGGKLIWNFAGAESVTVNRTFGGQVLATGATFSNLDGANVEGGVFAANLFQRGEIHLQPFTGGVPVTAVPEPEGYAMMGLGLGLLGLVARRRKPAPFSQS
ncbi:MAG: collagen-binding domain-containing protein [Pseudomonadota bacterium]